MAPIVSVNWGVNINILIFITKEKTSQEVKWLAQSHLASPILTPTSPPQYCLWWFSSRASLASRALTHGESSFVNISQFFLISGHKILYTFLNRDMGWSEASGTCSVYGCIFCSVWPRSEDKETFGMLVNCPAYYSMSAPKAELLNKIKAMPEEMKEEEEQVDVNEKKVKNWDLCSQKNS